MPAKPGIPPVRPRQRLELFAFGKHCGSFWSVEFQFSTLPTAAACGIACFVNKSRVDEFPHAARGLGSITASPSGLGFLTSLRLPQSPVSVMVFHHVRGFAPLCVWIKVFI
jgi:hypothetical protein